MRRCSGLAATLIAMVLGSLASYAVNRFSLFGRDTVSLIIVLPIALPGIVTGVALNSAFREGGVTFGYFTLIVAHATFCIVVVFNNVVARLRRLAPNVHEASADLGADLFQTFRFVTFPLIRSVIHGPPPAATPGVPSPTWLTSNCLRSTWPTST